MGHTRATELAYMLASVIASPKGMTPDRLAEAKAKDTFREAVYHLSTYIDQDAADVRLLGRTGYYPGTHVHALVVTFTLLEVERYRLMVAFKQEDNLDQLSVAQVEVARTDFTSLADATVFQAIHHGSSKMDLKLNLDDAREGPQFSILLATAFAALNDTSHLDGPSMQFLGLLHRTVLAF